MTGARRLDVLVVGGGVTGVTAALSLAGTGRSVGLIAGLPGAPASRAFALTFRSAATLARLGVWSLLDATTIGPLTGIDLATNGHTRTRFDSAETGLAALGYVVPEDALLAALAARLAQTPVIQRLAPGPLDQLRANATGLTLRVGSQTWTASLVVGADGSRSAVRTASDIGWQESGYGERAITAPVTSPRPHGGRAWQAFLAHGPLALLPLGEPQSRSLIWTVPETEGERLMALEDTAFGEALTEAAGLPVTLAGIRHSYPLVKARATRLVGDRVALVGDAARRVHPMAGQGLNLGLDDVECLTATIAEIAARGGDIGAMGCLRRYERTRHSEAAPMMGAIHGLHTLFTARYPFVREAGALGLALFDRLPWLKSLTMHYAAKGAVSRR